VLNLSRVAGYYDRHVSFFYLGATDGIMHWLQCQERKREIFHIIPQQFSRLSVCLSNNEHDISLRVFCLWNTQLQNFDRAEKVNANDISLTILQTSPS
jgi:hypothetical protein